MIVDDEILFDAFTPINLLTGAIARYRGANLGTMLLISLSLELGENALRHYYGHLLPPGPHDPTRNIAMGLLTSVAGWGLADMGMRGAFQNVE